jgi:thioredoxin-like negative regulator of GroEL
MMEGIRKEGGANEPEKEIHRLIDEGDNEEALKLIEQLPPGEKRGELTAWVGASYIEAGEPEKAKALVRQLMEQDELSPHAGAIIELLEANGDNEF